jgi:hypothetical protein
VSRGEIGTVGNYVVLPMVHACEHKRSPRGDSWAGTSVHRMCLVTGKELETEIEAETRYGTGIKLSFFPGGHAPRPPIWYMGSASTHCRPPPQQKILYEILPPGSDTALAQ